MKVTFEFSFPDVCTQTNDGAFVALVGRADDGRAVCLVVDGVAAGPCCTSAKARAIGQKMIREQSKLSEPGCTFAFLKPSKN